LDWIGFFFVSRSLSRTCNLTKYGCMNKFNGIMKINAQNQDAKKMPNEAANKKKHKPNRELEV